MAGLLDFEDPGMRMGLGLLAAAQAPRAQSAQMLMSLMNSMDMSAQRKAEAEWTKLERDRQQKQWAQSDKENALAAQFFRPGTQALAPLAGDEAAGILPSAGRPASPASFDMPGYAQAMMGLNPAKGMQLMQALQKEVPVDKIDPKAFTPASLAKFAQSRNYGDLVPRDKMEVSEGVVYNPYDATMAGRTLPNPNKPFQLAADGSIVPNKAYQQYELNKAAAGAAKTSVSVNTEKSFMNELASGMGKQIDSSLAAAKGAQSTLGTLNNLDAALSSGKVMAGPLTSPAQVMMQIGNQLGMNGKSANETLQNTRAAMQAMAQLELDSAAQMKGQGQITESERALLRKAASGDINMSLPEIQTLSKVARRTAEYRIAQHNQNVQPILQNPNAAVLAPFLTVPQSQSQSAGRGVIDFSSLK